MEILFVVILIFLAIIMSYAYIRFSIAKEKENELLNQALDQKERYIVLKSKELRTEFEKELKAKSILNTLNNSIKTENRNEV